MNLTTSSTRTSPDAYGIVPPESIYSGEFRVRNTGNAPLIMSNLNASCGCISATLTEYSIEPGHSATIAVKMNTPAHMGTFEQLVQVETNDPRKPWVKMSISGEARWEVASNKTRLQIRMAHGEGADAGQEFEIFSPTRSDFNVTKVSASSPWITVKMVGETDLTKRYRVMCDPPAVGKLVEEVVVETDCASRPLLTIPLDLHIGASNPLVPNRLLLGSQLGLKPAYCEW